MILGNAGYNELMAFKNWETTRYFMRTTELFPLPDILGVKLFIKENRKRKRKNSDLDGIQSRTESSINLWTASRRLMFPLYMVRKIQS